LLQELTLIELLQFTSPQRDSTPSQPSFIQLLFLILQELKPTFQIPFINHRSGVPDTHFSKGQVSSP